MLAYYNTACQKVLNRKWGSVH